MYRKRMLTWPIMILGMGLIMSCGHREIPAMGDQRISIFENEIVHFDPKAYEQENEKSGVLHLDNGRLLIKKVNLPKYERHTELSLEMELRSNGDRWDKSGSFFVLPKDAAINLMSVAEKRAEFPKPTEGLEDFVGAVAGTDYLPTQELMRFMTPFGVGAFNDKMDLRQPVYIPKWAEKVEWQQDITPLKDAVEGEVYLGVWIDTWTAEGYELSASIYYDESEGPCHAAKLTHSAPIANTVYYTGPMKRMDLFARRDLETTFTVPEGAKNVRIMYTTTGHGGHSGGDEFVPKANIVKVDGEEVLNFVPWRDDCASFRRFNPGTGVWVIKDTTEYIDMETWTYKQKVIEERLGSSDLSRSNWCPGSSVSPEEIALGDIAAGEHSISFSIPTAAPAEGDKANHWLIAAHVVWEE